MATKEPKYCTKCGAELVRKDDGIVSTGSYDAYTGEPIRIHRITLICPHYYHNYSESSDHDSSAIDMPIEVKNGN